MKRYRLGIDIGGTKVNLVVTDAAGELLGQRVLRVPQGISCKDMTQEAARAALDMLRELNIDKAQVCTPGIGIPGTVKGQMVLNAPNLHWQDELCGEYFRQAFGMTPILTQDTRAAAWGEYCLGEAKGRRCILCVTLGTGIGCGIVLNGAIYDGALGTAGEIGHIPVEPNGRLCNCGRRGCMEAYASGMGLQRTLEADETLLSRIPDTHALFTAAQNGDGQALSILDEATTYIAQALSAAVNLFSPDALILSGGLSEQALYVQPVIDKLRKMAYALAVGDRLLLGTSLLGPDAPALGAAMLANKTL